MDVEEIKLENLNPEKFVEDQIRNIDETVGNGLAVDALSGGVDSSVVTMLAHRALCDRLKTYFIDNGLMREGEPQYIVSLFRGLGVDVELIDASDTFFSALEGLTDPEEKREKGVTQPFYGGVFGPLVKKSGALYLLHGTNYTDVEETVAGVKRQHNILVQLGIDTEEQYGYKVLEPLVQLRKPAIREVAKVLGLPQEIYNRMPFPGPALAARVIGEVTREKVDIVRKATHIVEGELGSGYKHPPEVFQYLAILHEDKVTGIKETTGGKERAFGYQIEVRCWNSKDAVTATPTELGYDVLKRIANRITT
jgi:GMP synthase (glutamine-hydrolysing)